jgi:hypothetical protein
MAGLPVIKTDDEPAAKVSGGPVHIQLSPTIAAGKPAMSTLVLFPGNRGPPTCGTVPFTKGQVCISVALAAAAILI